MTTSSISLQFFETTIKITLQLQVNWGIAGSPKLVRWATSWLAPQLLSLYAIKLNIVPLTSGTQAAVNALQVQRLAGNLTNGPLDLIFINGLPFYNARSAGNSMAVHSYIHNTKRSSIFF